MTKHPTAAEVHRDDLRELDRLAEELITLTTRAEAELAKKATHDDDCALVQCPAGAPCNCVDVGRGLRAELAKMRDELAACRERDALRDYIDSGASDGEIVLDLRSRLALAEAVVEDGIDLVSGSCALGDAAAQDTEHAHAWEKVAATWLKSAYALRARLAEAERAHLSEANALRSTVRDLCEHLEPLRSRLALAEADAEHYKRGVANWLAKSKGEGRACGGCFGCGDDSLSNSNVCVGARWIAPKDYLRALDAAQAKDSGSRHRCTICGCLWRLNPPTTVQPNSSWSLWDGEQKPGACCDNVAMGSQIVPAPDVDPVNSTLVKGKFQSVEEWCRVLIADGDKVQIDDDDLAVEWLAMRVSARDAETRRRALDEAVSVLAERRLKHNDAPSSDRRQWGDVVLHEAENALRALAAKSVW